ncbi:MAG: ribonuclease HII [Moraxella sp.]|nr:ribonuclease HII [Moraxella sp.]
MIKAHTLNTHAHACTITAHTNHKSTSDTIVIGIDEVGRGSLFGQMTVGAVILDGDLTGEFGQIDLAQTPIALINDSKKLTEKKRTALFDPIKHICQSYALIDVPAFVIDAIDIYQATLLGMRLAIEHLIMLNNITEPHRLIVMIDGSAMPTLFDEFASFQPCLHTLIKGDGIHSSIACASILAKVHRDTVISDYAKIYPDYGLDKHKGYASKAHTNAIYTHGILPEHRKSFNPMRTILANTQNTLF